MVENQKITEVLKNLNDDLTKYAPPRVRDALPSAPAEPAPALLNAADGAAETIMAALEEARQKMTALEQNAEHGIKSMKAWMNEFANQHAELMATLNEFQTRVNQSVERIVEIGKKPLNGNPRGEGT